MTTRPPVDRAAYEEALAQALARLFVAEWHRRAVETEGSQSYEAVDARPPNGEETTLVAER